MLPRDHPRGSAQLSNGHKGASAHARARETDASGARGGSGSEAKPRGSDLVRSIWHSHEPLTRRAACVRCPVPPVCAARECRPSRFPPGTPPRNRAPTPKVRGRSLPASTSTTRGARTGSLRSSEKHRAPGYGRTPQTTEFPATPTGRTSNWPPPGSTGQTGCGCPPTTARASGQTPRSSSPGNPTPITRPARPESPRYQSGGHPPTALGAFPGRRLRNPSPSQPPRPLRRRSQNQ